MNDVNHRIESDLNGMRKALADSYSTRNKHIFLISLLLFASALIVLISFLVLIFQGAQKYGTITMTMGAGLVLVLILVILALILHGMSLGRMTSIMVGVLKSSLDVLANEIQTLVAEGTDMGSANSGSPNIETTRAQSSDRLGIARAQVQSIASELESAHGTIQNQTTSTDMAVFAYGFAGICALSTGVLASGSTEKAEFLRVLLLLIGMVCATACYAVLARPTTPQFLVEQTLRKLGLSVEALADSMRARAGKPPQLVSDDDLFEPEDIDNQRESTRG